MAELYPVGGLGWENEEDYGTVVPSPNNSGSSKPNPINPLLARTVAQGPLSELESSRYAYKTLKYPLDVEDNSRYQYYIKFNVLMNIQSNYTEKLSFGDSAQLTTMKTSQQEFFKKRLQTATGLLPSFSTTESKPVDQKTISALFKTQVVKTQQSISLYMPDTLNWSFQNDWESVNVTERLGRAGAGLSLLSIAAQAGKDIAASLPSLSVEELRKKMEQSGSLQSATAMLGEALGAATKNADLGLAAVGFALNPSIEVLYKQPRLREFQFVFVFAPRNKKEAETALTIIQMFKFHSAPEFFGGPDLGRYYVPPSQFDIEFEGRDGKVWQLGKFLSQCVLRNVSVNYGQTGQFATFEDGTPTNIQMQLDFQETAFITKEDVEQGY